MAADSSTLYKLMLLYMLNKVNFPLTNSQMTDFMVNKNYTSYFVVQESLNDLISLEYVKSENFHSKTQYQITKSGSSTVSLLDDQIPDAIKEDIMTYLKENKYELKSVVGTTATYYKNSFKDFSVHCQVKEDSSNLIELNVSVPMKEQAEVICANWPECSQEIYEFVMKKLLR